MVITETENLIFRQFHIVDGDVMGQVFGDAEAMKFGPDAGVKSREWVAKWLRDCLAHYCEWGFGPWAVVKELGRRTIGFCGLSQLENMDGNTETVLEYRLVARDMEEALAKEAVCAVCEYGIETLCLRRIISIIDPKNTVAITAAAHARMSYEKDVSFGGIRGKVHAFTLSNPTKTSVSPTSRRDRGLRRLGQ